MRTKPEIRPCKDCPEGTHTVCCFAFGKYWRTKSNNGKGCTNPLDGVAEAWRKAGWVPGEDAKAYLTISKETPFKPTVKRPTLRQAGLFASPPKRKPAEPPPLSDDDY